MAAFGSPSWRNGLRCCRPLLPLDYPTTLRQVAELAIERLADWCAVEINDAQGNRISRAVTNRDPSKLRWAEEMDARYPAICWRPREGRRCSAAAARSSMRS